MRRLRGYAFDPSLSIQFDTMLVNAVTFRVPWEDLAPGPVGEYVEVVDHDPASGCFYEPVDLNDPGLLAQDGLAPSEGDPKFHQQFVYAVVMLTIRNFERALGRRVLWSPRIGEGSRREGFVRRLRIYPHALREANAYYSPGKKALLFGYFPAAPVDPGVQLPGGLVFTCLSHDIVAHETTHALLDGMHRRYIEPTHPDSLAFHEAFADVVALFQHFSFPEVVRHQVAKRRGDLSGESLLGQLAQEFGHAVGSRGALRDALGEVDSSGSWKPRTPDPAKYSEVMEPHARGSILVAALFDAFTTIYRGRVTDLLRIASNGTGVLTPGELHPDLVNRLAGEASKTAGRVCEICIRALDYCPPTDLTFGEYLRALVTADAELVPDDEHFYRVAFIESFRRHGIYPRGVRSLSVESLRWQKVADPKSSVDHFEAVSGKLKRFFDSVLRPTATREDLFEHTLLLKARFHDALLGLGGPALKKLEHTTGLVLNPVAGGPRTSRDTGLSRFEVHSVRPARRVGPSGGLLNEIVVVITQWRWAALDPEKEIGPQNRFRFRGGCTLIFDLDDFQLKYVIRKSVMSVDREKRQRAYIRGSAGASLRSLYLGNPALDDGAEPFAALHREL